jgi:hypothetical protein
MQSNHQQVNQINNINSIVNVSSEQYEERQTVDESNCVT